MSDVTFHWGVSNCIKESAFFQVSPDFNHFLSHAGPQQNAEDAKKFILKMYMAQHTDRHKPLYSHYTCATDTENIRIVFKSVKDTLLQESLEQFNLEWPRLSDHAMAGQQEN